MIKNCCACFIKERSYATGFIVAIAVLNAEAVLSETGRYIPANQSTIGHRKSEGLKVIYRTDIPLVIIRARIWRRYSRHFAKD